MKSNYTIILFLLFISFPILAQWNQLSEPEGGTIYSLVEIDEVLWAGTQGGLYLSDNEGQTWTRSELVRPEGSVLKVVETETEIMMTVTYIDENYDDWDVELHRSLDKGMTWQIATLPFQFRDFHGLLNGTTNKLFRISDKLFIFLDNDFYRSLDDGVNWERVTSNQISFFSGIGHDDTNIVAADFFSSFISSDGGDTWTFLDSIGTQRDIAVKDDLIFISSYGSLVVSEDLGQTWELKEFSESTTSLHKLYISETGVLYTFGPFIHRSEDNGDTWVQVNDEYQGGAIDFIEVENDEYFIGNINGFSKTEQNGNHWIPFNSGILASTVFRIFNSPQGDVFTITNIGKFRSSDSGQNWEVWEAGLPHYVFNDIEWLNDDVAFVSTINGLFKSEDHLNSLEKVDLGVQSNSMSSVEIHDGIIYVTIDFANIIFVSDDMGESWFNMPLNQPYLSRPRLFIKDDVFLLLSERDEIYRTTDLGLPWELAIDLRSPGVNSHVLRDIGDRILLINDEAWFYTTDLGISWVEFIPSGLPILNDFDEAPEISSLLSVDGVLYATIRFNGVFKSEDFGETWEPYVEGLGNFRTRGLAYVNGTMLLGTSQGGIWGTSLASLPTSTTSNKDVKMNILLSPNPNQGNFTIELPKVYADKAMVHIYSLLGELVYTNELELDSQEINIETHGLPAGKYIVTLSIEDAQFLSKLTLLK